MSGIIHDCDPFVKRNFKFLALTYVWTAITQIGLKIGGASMDSIFQFFKAEQKTSFFNFGNSS
jgi:hypothetical protein